MSWTITRRTFLWTTFAAAGSLVTTSCTNRESIRIGLVTDSHYADREPSGTRYYRQSLDKMQEFVQLMNKEKVDFVMHMGDFKDEDPQKREADTLKYLRALEAIYAQFDGPRYHCIGNHDVDSITKQQFLSNIENTGISKTESYYHFEKNGFQFIVLDANYHEDGRDHFYQEGADWQKPHIPSEELDWLKTTLNKSALPTIVFCHHPIYPYADEEAIFYVGNHQTVQEILEQSEKVLAVFQGHTHEDDHQQINGIHYSTMLGMVDYSGIENNAYAIVEIYPGDRIDVIGYRRVGKSSLALV